MVAAGGVKNGKHVAPIISRRNWTTELDLVGHTNSIVCCVRIRFAFLHHKDFLTLFLQRFNPVMFVEKGHPLVCCALGGQDHLVSIWVTTRPRAILVVDNLFSTSVLDLAW